ncbi:hypothetical protein K502DRAFT_361798 [Neoconidiobolus thromboides FSU 785]|nr:hypothetical protein K502DRAFT_361798 [Neoconidiobolus thromboides FSU 785]
MYFKVYLLLLLTFISFILSQDDEKPKKGKSSGGSAASTDATTYAGVYQMTYYYNLDSATNTTQLKCNSVDGFTLSIPDASSVEVQRDFSNVTNGKDPVYNTQQGSWVIKEVAGNDGFDTIKLKVFINDVDETLVCWDITKQGNDILINIDPKQPDSCPTRFIPTTKTCLSDHAFLFGKCLSGVCAGEKPKSAKKGGKNNDNSGVLSVASGWMGLMLVIVGVALF